MTQYLELRPRLRPFVHLRSPRTACYMERAHINHLWCMHATCMMHDACCISSCILHVCCMRDDAKCMHRSCIIVHRACTIHARCTERCMDGAAWVQTTWRYCKMIIGGIWRQVKRWQHNVSSINFVLIDFFFMLVNGRNFEMHRMIKNLHHCLITEYNN